MFLCGSQALLNLLGVLAEFERDLLRERVKLGQAVAKVPRVWLARRLKIIDERKILRDYQALHSILKWPG